jgi:hypothetical protein
MTTPPSPQPFSPPPVPPTGPTTPNANPEQFQTFPGAPVPPTSATTSNANPGQFQTFPGAPVPPSAPAPKKRPWFLHPRIVGAVATLLVVGAVAIGNVVYQNLKTSPYQVGTCIHEISSTSIESVQCDAANASYEIVARYNETEPVIGVGSCESVDSADSAWWEGTKGKTGLLLCLKAVK